MEFILRISNNIFLILVAKKENLICDTKNPTYIGCYSDDSRRDLSYRPGTGKYDQSSCSKACKDFTYFSLQHYGECFCGNEYGTRPQYVKKSDDECGGPRGLGKSWTNAIYERCTKSGNN